MAAGHVGQPSVSMLESSATIFFGLLNIALALNRMQQFLQDTVIFFHFCHSYHRVPDYHTDCQRKKKSNHSFLHAKDRLMYSHVWRESLRQSPGNLCFLYSESNLL